MRYSTCKSSSFRSPKQPFQKPKAAFSEAQSCLFRSPKPPFQKLKAAFSEARSCLFRSSKQPFQKSKAALSEAQRASMKRGKAEAHPSPSITTPTVPPSPEVFPSLGGVRGGTHFHSSTTHCHIVIMYCANYRHGGWSFCRPGL